MRQNLSLKWFVLATMVVSFITVPAWGDLRPVVQESGSISLSVDAEGNNNIGGGTIRVQRPAGATVRRAFLMANSHGVNGLRVILDGEITLAGVPIIWDRSEFNGIPCCPSFFHNVFAEVTSIVKPIIDAAPPGIKELQVTETGTTQVNGTILVVIFDDPNETSDNSVLLLFGGQATVGETFLISLAEPIDPAIDRADMGIGIGHGFQGFAGTPMVNLIDVNGQRLTSSAGGEDDGASVNGALITVGGIGDSNANPPDPNAPSTGLRTDDELYDLRPFVGPGDTQIEVSSFNPTDDDNIFFAYFFTSVPAGILPDVPSPGTRNINTVDGRPIDPNLPTIVLTHGLGKVAPSRLWTDFSDNPDALGAGHLLNDLFACCLNILQYVWEEANQVTNLPDADEYRAARQYVSDAGTTLGRLLLEELNPDGTYNRPIHFVGHSLGTAVNAYAARLFLGSSENLSLSQFTILDYPHNIGGEIRKCDLTCEELFGFSDDFFAALLQPVQQMSGLRIDNYFSLTNAGVGDEANGRIYNHSALVEPNDVGNRFFDDETVLGFQNNHSGVQQWYRWTMSPDGFGDCGPGGLFDRPPFFDPTLDPCRSGFQWSPFGPRANEFPVDQVGAPVDFSGDQLALGQELEFGCTLTNRTITCQEASSPFIVFKVDIPDDAAFLAFEYRFTNVGDGDYAAVHLDDVPIWVLSGSSATEGEFVNSGPIPIGDLTGHHTLTIALYGVGETNAGFELQNLTTLSVAEPIIIDIKPRRRRNIIELEDDDDEDDDDDDEDDDGDDDDDVCEDDDRLRVAVLGTPDFDALTVDELTVELGDPELGGKATPIRSRIKDVNRDGRDDLLFVFTICDLLTSGALNRNTAELVLAGATLDGTPIAGRDSVRVVVDD